MERFDKFLNLAILSLHFTLYFIEECCEFRGVDSDFEKVSKRQVHYRIDRIESWKITNILNHPTIAKEDIIKTPLPYL